MKKKIFCTLISLIMIMSLVGCGHEHNFAAATCTQPKTCIECGATEGEPSGHDWNDATCTEPKTCVRCGATEGEPLGHDWNDATCTEPKTCARCGATEGEPLDHDWVEATLTEPKTCTRCGATEGIPLTEDEYVEAVLANEEFYEDGAFVPKLYAQSLGYKWWCDGDFSVNSNGVEFFVWYNYGENVKLPGITVMYTDGEKYYEFDVVDRLKEDRTDIIKLKFEDTEDQNSKLYISATIAVLHRLTAGESNIRDWKFDDLAYGYFQWDNSPKYFDDGYIDASGLTKNEENSFTVSYK